MSFEKRMRKSRSLASVAIFALAGAVGQPANLPGANAGANLRQAPTEFVDPKAAKAGKRVRAGIGGPIGDSQLPTVNSKHLRRRVLLRMAGMKNTGRQWIRLRRELRRTLPHLLTMRCDKLMQIARTSVIRRDRVAA